jgi:adenylosuccinate lyase
MNLEELTAISPVDGRYRKHVKELANYFSEYALIRIDYMLKFNILLHFAKYLYLN